MAAVVVSGKDEGFLRQSEELLRDGIVLLAGVATSKVTTASAMDEQGVSGEDPILSIKADAIGCVARGVEHSQSDGADGDWLPVVNVDIDVRGWRASVHDHWCASQVMQLPTGSAVVSVSVSVDDGVELAIVIGQHGQIAIDFIFDRIDQRSFMGVLTSQEIGFTLAAVQFAKQHTRSSSTRCNRVLVSK